MFSLPHRFRQRLARTSVEQRIANAAFASGGAAIFVKSAAFLKEALVAAVFGVSFELDAYLIALMLVGLPHGIVVNAVQWVLIPEFVRVEAQDGIDCARALLRRTVSLTLLLLGVFLIAWVLCLPLTLPFLTDNLGQGSIGRIRQCFILLCIYYFTSGILLLGYAVLQARRQFIRNGLVPLATPVVSALLVAIWRRPVAELLAVGMVIGFLTELFFVQRMLQKQSLTLMPCRLTFSELMSPGVMRVAKLAPGAAVMALMPLVEQASAAQLGVGAVSTLGFANKLPTVVSSLSVVAIGVAIFPFFSDMVARNDAAACLKILRLYGALLTVGGAVVAVVLIAFSGNIIQTFFHRGAFSDAAALAVSSAQQAYLLQLPGALVLALSIRLILARGRSGWLTLLHGLQLTVFVVALGISLNFWITPSCIALSYSIAVTVTAMVAYWLAGTSIQWDKEQGQ